MTIDELNILHKKAETRKDGIYSFRGNLWAVKNRNFIAFADFSGNILLRQGAFNHVAGKVESYQRKDALKKFI